jgi:hydroxymethylglutaryl-CoA lyase
MLQYIAMYMYGMSVSTSSSHVSLCAAGNVATEDVIYMLSGFGIHHGVDLEKLVDASSFICEALGQETNAHVSRAMLAARKRHAQAAMCA